jgi:hypothetical protein
MNKLKRTDLFTLEAYATERTAFRALVLAHKHDRKIALGDHISLLFEDRLTVQYQIQEMLRIERIFEAPAINEELDSYNPLIPDGSNLKATMLIEYEDADERKVELARLVGIEDRIVVSVDGHPPVTAIADEDMERSNESKTSAVHFLRFEFSPGMISSARGGARIEFASTHPYYLERAELTGASRATLLADFD